MAKSWEEQISPSASFPVCMSLWLAKKAAHAKTQLSQSPFVSIPIFVHFTNVCPTLHYGCAELQWLIAYFKSAALAHMDRYQTNENVLIVWLQFYKVCVQFTFSYSRMSRHICPWPRCSFVHCICSQTKPVFNQTIPTAWQHSPISINAKTVAALPKWLSAIVSHFGSKVELAAS